jgi:hypothetical protein
MVTQHLFYYFLKLLFKYLFLDFLSTLLNAEDLNSKDPKESTESDEPSDKLALPDSVLSIVIGGFVPR